MNRRSLMLLAGCALWIGATIPAHAADGTLDSIQVATKTQAVDGSFWINAAQDAGPITVNGKFTPATAGETTVHVLLVAFDPAAGETCNEANVRKTELREASTFDSDLVPGLDAFTISFTRPDRVGFSDGDRVCAIGYATSNGTGTSRLASSVNPTIDTQIAAGTIALDAAGAPVDTDGLAATTGDLVDWINDAEANAATPATVAIVADDDGDDDDDATTHDDYESATLTINGACPHAVANLGGTETVTVTEPCLDAQTDGAELIATVTWRDLARNSITGTSRTIAPVANPIPVRLDRTAPAAASIALAGASIDGRNVVNETNVAAVPVTLGDVEPASSVLATISSGAGSVTNCPAANVSTCVPRAADEDVSFALNVTTLADCATADDCIAAAVTVTDLAGNQTSTDAGAVAFKDATDAPRPTITPANLQQTEGGAWLVRERLSLSIAKVSGASEDADARITIADGSAATADVVRSGRLTGSTLFVPNMRTDELESGPLTVSVTLSDDHGNVQAYPTLDSYVHEPSASGITVATPARDAVVGAGASASGTIGVNVPSVQARIDGGTSKAVTVTAGGFSKTLASISDGPLAEGAHTLRISAPGTATVAVPFTVDASAPNAATVDQPAIGPLVIAPNGVLSGSLADLDADELGSDDAASVRAAVVGPFGNTSQITATIDDGAWSIALLPGTPGPYTVTLTTLDEAGNATASDAVTVIALSNALPGIPAAPTVDPSTLPVPSVPPTGVPSGTPTGTPSVPPTGVPSGTPSGVPTGAPTALPTSVPTVPNP